jgi:HTH-type transcriptional regulator/antitoxin HigA
MALENKNQFTPDFAIHPGEILEETLQARSITNRDLAARSGISEKHISQIINGKSSVTPDMAILLERILDIKAELWLKLDSDYRFFMKKQHV